MKKQFLFNKLINFVLKPDLPQNAEDSALYLFSSEACEGLWYYVKLVPCKKNGFIPQVGTFTQDEINAHDVKVLKKKEASLIKMLKDKFPSAQKPAASNVNWLSLDKKTKIIN